MEIIQTEILEINVQQLGVIPPEIDSVVQTLMETDFQTMEMHFQTIQLNI